MVKIDTAAIIKILVIVLKITLLAGGIAIPGMFIHIYKDTGELVKSLLFAIIVIAACLLVIWIFGLHIIGIVCFILSAL